MWTCPKCKTQNDEKSINCVHCLALSPYASPVMIAAANKATAQSQPELGFASWCRDVLVVVRNIWLVALALFFLALLHAYRPYVDRQQYDIAAGCGGAGITRQAVSCSTETLRVMDKHMESSFKSGPSWYVTLSGAAGEDDVELVHDDGDRSSCGLYGYIHIGDVVAGKLWKGRIAELSMRGYVAQTTLNPDYLWIDSGPAPMLMCGLAFCVTGALFLGCWAIAVRG